MVEQQQLAHALTLSKLSRLTGAHCSSTLSFINLHRFDNALASIPIHSVCGQRRYPKHTKMHFPCEMKFVRFVRPFSRSFEFFCVSYCAIYRSMNHRANLHRFYFGLCSVLLIMCAIHQFDVSQFKLQSMRLYDSPIFLYVGIGTRALQFLSCIAIPIETILQRHTEQKIFATIAAIDNTFRTKCNHIIDYRPHRHDQLRSASLFLFNVMLALFMSSMFNILAVREPSFLAFFEFSYTFAMMRIRLFQIAFFINVVIGLLHELKIMMRRQQQRIRYNANAWKEIQFSRQIYSQIWCLSALIGDCFGWSMLLFVGDTAIKLLSTIHWIYLYDESLQMQSELLHVRKWNGVDMLKQEIE